MSFPDKFSNSKISVPNPPVSVSTPDPPNNTSSPSPPFRVSSPAEAQITSEPDSPLISIAVEIDVFGDVRSTISSPAPPLIVSMDIKRSVFFLP